MDGMHELRREDAEDVRLDTPFTLIEPLRSTTPLIFASPHSGRRYPDAFLAHSRARLASLRRSEDAYVDELISDAVEHGASVVCATYARAFVDLNRDPAELDPEMYEELLPQAARPASARVQAGLGAIPRITGDGLPIYGGKFSVVEARRRIDAIHTPYHALLSSLVGDAVDHFGCAVLIDCHSMPSCARGGMAPDIVLGDRFGASCHPSITALVEAVLTRRGYRVIRNTPFAGGHTTQHYGKPGERTHALQVEINRGLYMDEHSMTRTRGFERVRADMTALAETLATAALHRSLA